jgi:hypothetical protein
MRAITLTILLLAAAGRAHEARAAVDTATTHPATKADPPPKSQEPAQHWTPSLRATVMRQCQQAFPDETMCACFTRQLEVLSRDSEVVTAENMQAALKRCREA